MVLTNDMVPTNTADYSAYILKIRSLKPDFVYLNLAGVDQTTFLKQYKEYNLPYPLAGGVMDTVPFWAAGLDNLSGHWQSLWYHGLTVPASQAFTKQVSAEVRHPARQPGLGRLRGRAHRAADHRRDQVHRRASPSSSTWRAAPTFDILKERKGSFRAWDHQLLQEMYVVKVKDKAQSKDKWDIFERRARRAGTEGIAGADPADARRRIRARWGDGEASGARREARVDERQRIAAPNDSGSNARSTAERLPVARRRCSVSTAARPGARASRLDASRLTPDAMPPIVPELILEQVINGLLVGTLYIVLSLGLSLIFSLGGVVNLAHGAFYARGRLPRLRGGEACRASSAQWPSRRSLVALIGIAHRTAVPEPALQQGSGAGPAVHVRAGDGRGAGAADDLGHHRPALLDSGRSCAASSSSAISSTPTIA